MSLVVEEQALPEAREFDGCVFPLTLGPNEPCTVEQLCVCATFVLNPQPFHYTLISVSSKILLHSYLKANRERTAAQLLLHGAILFRGALHANLPPSILLIDGPCCRCFSYNTAIRHYSCAVQAFPLKHQSTSRLLFK